jgi:hypothetical protein
MTSPHLSARLSERTADYFHATPTIIPSYTTYFRAGPVEATRMAIAYIYLRCSATFIGFLEASCDRLGSHKHTIGSVSANTNAYEKLTSATDTLYLSSSLLQPLARIGSLIVSRLEPHQGLEQTSGNQAAAAQGHSGKSANQNGGE